jgi:DNA-binding phage protein
MTKIDKHTTDWNDFMLEQLKDEEFAKGYLNESLKEYIETGDFKLFFKSLEDVVKARSSIRKFAKNAKIDRANLCAILKGKRKPQLHTVLKIFSELGYLFKVA